MEMWGFLFLTISSGLRCAVRTKMEKTCSTTTGNGLETSQFKEVGVKIAPLMI